MNSSIKFNMVKISDLIPYANNSRTHSDEQVAQIAASIAEFGFTNPVLVAEDNVLIAGHGRLLAARLAGLKEVPAMVIAGLTPTQRKALVLADNRIALSAGWDAKMLGLELQALMEDGYDMALTGFDEDEISKFLADEANEGLADPDEVPEVPEEPITKMGDIWLLGKHRIMCGDSTIATNVEALLDGVTPHLMVTDPPYGVEYDANFRNGIIRENGTKVSARAVGKVMNDDKADWTEAWALFPGEVCYVWHAGLHSQTVAQSLINAGFEIRSQIIWAKSNFAIGRGHYHWKHEPCWYAVKARGGGNGALERRPQANNLVGNTKTGEIGNGPQHAETCRVHETAHCKQQFGWSGGI